MEKAIKKNLTATIILIMALLLGILGSSFVVPTSSNTTRGTVSAIAPPVDAPVTADLAYSYDASTTSYKVTGIDNTWRLSNPSNDNVSIIIPATYNGPNGIAPVTVIAVEAFRTDYSSLTNYVIRDVDFSGATNLLSLESGVFFGCSALTETPPIFDSLSPIFHFSFKSSAFA